MYNQLILMIYVKMFNYGQYKHLCKAHIPDKTNYEWLESLKS